MPDFAVIIPAAGGSTRFGGPRSKLLERVAGKPVLRHSIAAFARRSDVKMIVVAATAGPRSVRRHVPQSSFVIACDGGTCRAGSVRNALACVPSDIEWVAVHDAARPLVSQELIDRTFAAAVAHGAAVAAMPVALTVRQADGPLPARSQGVIPRDRLWAMQTPQIMRRADLARAFEECPLPLEQVTDDVQLLELIGREVWLVPGEEANLKVTTPLDLVIAQTLWERRSK
jgi:2-C-methyl-D-erythritol 4-phosphate cytidylyltransferase